MGFRINTNIGALNAHANSVVNAGQLDKSLSRLSSGLRINSAADDASGMAIADSLRSQAATLGQAINNGNDAIGILQTADKAMDEQLKILDTIKTKATQAAQDGQSLKTRTMLQADINRLMEELDNIANTTSFNGKQLLSGGFINQEFQIGSQSNQTIKATIGPTQSSKIGLTRFETGTQIIQSSEVEMVIKNYNGLEDFKFPKIKISTSVGTGIGALAEEINRVADKTGVRASFNVQTAGSRPVMKGTTTENFAINGVIIGKISYENNDSNGALIAAINAVKDTTGVQAALDENGKLLLTSADGRGIKITGAIGAGAGIATNMMENYGRLSLVKNDGRDIAIEGTGFGFENDKLVSQASVSLRETKGQISKDLAEAMGFNSVERLGSIQIGVSALSVLEGSGMSTITTLVNGAGSGFSQWVTSKISNVGQMIDIGPGLGKLTTMSFTALGISGLSSLAFSAVYTVAINALSTVRGDLLVGSQQAGGLSVALSALGVTRETKRNDNIGQVQTAGVTTLKGAMAVMDVVETATINLDQIRADIGAVQNQLQVTINNITVTQVNVKAAESTIRDVDFAAESANFSKYNILAQSGSYAMSQANQVQQNVLKLLQ
ncbi:flagellin [Campylobacter upsaliensis]|uniref:flagellin n=1 Tax=Campylobacter upsaliensis TaxID=28080 RepID=UPI00126B98F8|nr:flagellin [Campylobacter upsaliensis]EAH8539342.1 flagellin [Campylobacter upsaliensis]EAJ7571954.1 flagellin [Campylobacter upsaliensis]EAJ7579112.1 flagellin [Campylobacter upsaliensis]EAK1467791.1 flagellin [Campylobacter upsaliensis]ECP5135913.1 flagellin [Campylobacter upsaliensis]